MTGGRRCRLPPAFFPLREMMVSCPILPATWASQRAEVREHSAFGVAVRQSASSCPVVQQADGADRTRMRTGEYRLRDGRKGAIKKLHLTRTYEGMLSGTRKPAASTFVKCSRRRPGRSSSPSPFAGRSLLEAAIATTCGQWRLESQQAIGTADPDHQFSPVHLLVLQVLGQHRCVSPSHLGSVNGTNTRRTMTSQLCELVDIQQNGCSH